ncbi:MBL fold metallo-hydrolase [Streptomyces sp. NRRL F-5123]|uniref:MBL fold metallo-hydrolase n=1 Tax=Streptomyces sp. NRRL F-5123 TaxID=1463856 RepID=UPI0007C4446C|nr:MBL fold metallo-hydrolase [Streptomyces sp. NRRL F-5123]
MSFPLPQALRSLTPNVHAWLPDGHATWGMANCVVVTGRGTGPGTALLVDTPYTAGMTRQLQRLVAGLGNGSQGEGGFVVRTVVNTHGNGDHSYGNALFPGADVIATDANGEHLCAEPEPAVLAGLVAAADPATPMGAYMRRHFARYGDFGGVTPLHPNRTFSGELDLDVDGVAVRLIEVGPAHTAGDLIVHLPQEGVVCAGDVVFNEDHPVHWAGPLESVHAACVRILECDPRVVVPGHGPVMTPADVRRYADYLLDLREVIHRGHAAGRPLPVLAADLLAADPYPQWGLSERMAILAAVEYRALEGATDRADLVALVGLAAGFADTAAAADGGGREKAEAPRDPAGAAVRADGTAAAGGAGS